MKKLMAAARLTRGVVVTAVAGLASSSAVFGSAASASVKLPSSGVETPSGGTVSETGSTLLYPLFNLWAGGYNTKFPSTTIQTAGTGSGTGISEAENGTIDIGASDAYLSPSVVSANPDLKNIPTGDLGADGGLQRPGRASSHLKLSGKLVSEIYQGQVTKWNDSAIASANPGVTLPSTPIVALHRSDSRGDTFIFTQYLSKADPSGWGTKIGYNTTVPWPAAPGALGETGNSGMVSGCKATPGCIAYIGISYLTQVLQAGPRVRRPGQRPRAVRGADAGVHRSGGRRLREEDAGQRHHLADLRQHQQRLPDRQLRVRHRLGQAVEFDHGQEHPFGARVGDQQQVREQHLVPVPGQLPAAALQGRGAVA